jgi:excisionase family DNA binding protein
MPAQHPATPQRPVKGLLGRDGFINSDELAEYLRVPLATLDQWASRGGGPAFHKFGRHRRYLPSDVRAWIESNRRDDD